jgi:dTDP-glucose 4,6-dehydratase
MYSLHIIGGSGFFGKSFLEKNAIDTLKSFNISKVIISSRSCQKKKTKINSIEIVSLKSDITKCKDLPISDFIIFAATTSLKKNYDKSLKAEIKNSNKGISNFIKIISKKKFLKSTILFSSSGAVYGVNNEKKKLKETKKIYLKNVNKLSRDKYYYALAKLDAEKKLFKLHQIKKNRIFIARCFAFIGNQLYLKEHFFIGNIIDSIIKKKILIVRQNNLNEIYRSYMHTDDLVRWLLTIMFKSKKNFDIYNVGSDETFSIKSILILSKKLFFLKFHSKNMNKREIEYYIPDINKAKKELKLGITNKLKKSLEEVIEYNKKKLCK